MNSKGFTLVELIITIALLSMLFSLIATNMVGLQSRQLQSNYNNYKKEIESAACLFIDSKDAAMDGAIYSTVSFSETSEVKFGNADQNKEKCLEIEACYIKTKTLLETGYLDKDLVDPSTSEKVTESEVVRIEYLNGEKHCTYYSN